MLFGYPSNLLYYKLVVFRYPKNYNITLSVDVVIMTMHQYWIDM